MVSSHRFFPAVGSTTPTHQSKRRYNFGSQRYEKCFGDLPAADVDALREQALAYLKDFKPQTWYDEPVTTILRGEKLSSGTPSTTVDAFNRPNGRIIHSTSSETQSLLSHVRSYESPYTDLRPEMREIEATLLEKYAGFLIGNQMTDFWKFDGVTELEESTMANEVERRMNDALLEDETAPKIRIKRTPAFVGCVSNFSNFLDLFRKTIRNLECGVPIVILSRSNTTQHSYRWTELLLDQMTSRGIDAGMLTYASCRLDDVKQLLRHNPDSPMYVTCSRAIAAAIKKGHDRCVASTGGPNTLVATEYTPDIAAAVALSATIESSGQCTALRHAVLPGVTDENLEDMFDGVESLTTDGMPAALEAGKFSGIILPRCADYDESIEEEEDDDGGEYTKHSRSNVWYRTNASLPPDDMNENWRKVAVDVTTTLDVPELSRWLVRNQPISLAINVATAAPDDWDTAKQLFEQTGLVVYTVGSTSGAGDTGIEPSLTCQARPQEGEIFGEFPVRRELDRFTQFPVVVPSSTPSYDTCYDESFLETRCRPAEHLRPGVGYVASLIDAVRSPAVKGYCVELVNYITEAASGPNRASGARTTLWGWQRPPLNGTTTVLRCDCRTGEEEGSSSSSSSYLDGLLPVLLPFLLTNARSQVEISVASEKVLSELKRHGIIDCGVKVSLESSEMFFNRTDDKTGEEFYNVVTLDSAMTEFPMLGQFLSLYFPLGHIKSTKANHEEFWEYFEKSDKWLRMNENEL